MSHNDEDWDDVIIEAVEEVLGGMEEQGNRMIEEIAKRLSKRFHKSARKIEDELRGDVNELLREFKL